jgi:hypothetical protein
MDEYYLILNSLFHSGDYSYFRLSSGPVYIH